MLCATHRPTAAATDVLEKANRLPKRLRKWQIVFPKGRSMRTLQLNFLLRTPRRHGVSKSFSHSKPRHDMVVSRQPHAPAALSSVKYPLAPREQETGWSPVTMRPLKEKISCHCQESNHFSLVVQPVD